MRAELKDISRNGIGFYSDRPADVGMHSSFTIGRPYLDVDEPLEIGLVVVRCIENTDVDDPQFRYELGCRLDEPLPEGVLRRLAAGILQ